MGTWVHVHTTYLCGGVHTACKCAMLDPMGGYIIAHAKTSLNLY